MSRFSFALLALALVACEPADETAPDASANATAESPASPPEPAPVPEAATPTSVLLVDYEGRLDDGTVFDDGQNVEFVIPQLIDGMQEALIGMRAGESKTLTIPPEEAYGPQGIPGVIPPNASLTFDVTVHEILR